MVMPETPAPAHPVFGMPLIIVQLVPALSAAAFARVTKPSTKEQ